ncbi:MAG: hypothetical protein ACP5HZ_04620 [Ferrimicrobium sp.]|uniref:hypothetical protein n=1 Tax=Ferrimicrobium sp. TaxID=2926050 RepID=UPI00260B711F|nr:hypothetical protein [Ferrimicrobium sp.]
MDFKDLPAKTATDEITSKLVNALDEIATELTFTEEIRRHQQALRRLETSSLSELLGYQHGVRLTIGLQQLQGRIAAYGPDALRLLTEGGRTHLISPPAITSVQFITTRTEAADELPSFLAELERITNGGNCLLMDTFGHRHALERLITIAEDYLYYRSHGGIPTALRLSCIALVSPELPVS